MSWLTAVVLILVADGFAIYGRPAPELQYLFAPKDALAATYRAFVSPDAIESVVARARAAQRDWPANAWKIEPLEPLDGFGAYGRYDRYRLLRLYGGRRVRVARGPLLVSGVPVGSVTMVSPYPDPDLHELRDGTLTLVTLMRAPNPQPPTPQPPFKSDRREP